MEFDFPIDALTGMENLLPDCMTTPQGTEQSIVTDSSQSMSHEEEQYQQLYALLMCNEQLDDDTEESEEIDDDDDPPPAPLRKTAASRRHWRMPIMSTPRQRRETAIVCRREVFLRIMSDMSKQALK